MSSGVQTYSSETRSVIAGHMAAVFRRAPLVMITFIFVMVSFRYLAHPVRTATAAGISFTSPAGITVARIGFGAFPLAFAILTFSCLISNRRLLAGLYMALTVISVVTVVRIIAITVDHSASQAAFLLIPETILLFLLGIGIRLELARRQREGVTV